MTKMSAGQAAFETARLVSSHTPAALKLVSAYVASVQPSSVGPLMENLRSALPLGSLQHLKRVRKGREQQAPTEVLLCALNDLEQQLQQQQEQQQQQQQTDNCRSNGQATASASASAAAVQADQQQQPYPPGLPPCTTSVLVQLQAHVTVQQVPGGMPDNRQQWQEWVQHWPMAWRCPTGAAEQQDGTAPSKSDQAYFEQHMAAVMAASAAAGGRNVARIVDPKTGTVLAEAVDASACHPLDHAAMCAVETVAARDRQLWPFNGFAHVGRHAESPDAGGYVATPTQHPVCSPRGQAGSAAAEGAWQKQQDDAQQQQGGKQQQQQQDGKQQHQVGLPPCKKHKVGDNSSSSSSNGSSQAAAVATVPGSGSDDGAASAAVNGNVDWSMKPYLCTGYDCFLAREPCIMCSMALVHSRLARVIYCQPDTQNGALGGRVRLHAQRSLNHHYLVYQMPLKQQQQ